MKSAWEEAPQLKSPCCNNAIRKNVWKGATLTLWLCDSSLTRWTRWVALLLKMVSEGPITPERIFTSWWLIPLASNEKEYFSCTTWITHQVYCSLFIVPYCGKSMLPEKLPNCAISQFSKTFKIRCKLQACYPSRRDQAHAVLFISKFIP